MLNREKQGSTVLKNIYSFNFYFLVNGKFSSSQKDILLKKRRIIIF